jgi:hypothetical protein
MPSENKIGLKRYVSIVADTEQVNREQSRKLQILCEIVLLYNFDRFVGWLGINRFFIVLRLVAIEGILVERIVATAVAAPSLTTCPAATIRTKCFLLVGTCKSPVRSGELRVMHTLVTPGLQVRKTT